MPTEYENWYFDGDPDRWEREAEEAAWRAKTITPGSASFEYCPECPLCVKGSMHDFDAHYAAQIADRKHREEAQALLLVDCEDDPHPF